MATTILISGVLMDGTGNPIPDCDITLTALRTSRSVVAKTSGLGATSSAGEYSLTVPPGDYRVTLCIDGYPPAEPGMIHVYADSTPGTLNDFLLAPGESDLTPDILKQLEELAKAAKASADAAAGSAAASAASADGAAKSASDAGDAAKAAKSSETNAASSACEAASSAMAAENSAKAAKTSEMNAKSSETAAAQSASSAEGSKTAADSSARVALTSAGQAAASATAAEKSAESASSSAATATNGSAEATRQADAAKTSETNAKSSEMAAASSASSAASLASSASASKDEATRQALAAADSASMASTRATEAADSATASAASAADAAKSASDAGNAAGEAQKYRDEAKEFADHLDVKDASTSQKGIVQLSSATDSDSETVAATPKAVKAAMDNANGRLEKNSNGGDIPDKKQFARTIGAVTSTNITFNNASGWYKIATVVMPQATSTAVIKLYGGAGFNVGLFEQAAISELVLRAGNGSPVGITATLWRRSPTSANEVAWVNTSGDTYDIYINIGQHAYWLIAQYDYTSNANVTLYSTPEYSSVQPGNSTSGQTYTIYSSLMKPTAGNVGALPITGGRLNGPLGIGTDNALGGNSIVLGDNDTGIKWHSDGVLGLYANNALVGYIDNSGLHMSVDVLTNGAVRAGNAKKLSLTSNNNSALNAGFNLWGDGGNRPTVIELGDDQGWHLYSQRNPDGSIQFVVNGQVIPDNYGNFDARYLTSGNVYTKGESDNRYVQNIQRGAPVWPGKVDEYGPAEAPAGCFLTQARHDPTTAYGVTFAYRPLQMWVGNGWRTING
ncbi:shikimate transporter [Salmonella enterica subsp. enterica]|uniref:Shikimate transporter n=1 Tax=Salmonella enterica TaxID=28901 RepID=A0A760NGG0_SALER|nr:shikimate transporter [Salmonella enterica subsp. enterica]HAG2585854.1 shikimate transporter [Salmonella enterica]